MWMKLNITVSKINIYPRRYPYFDEVVGLAWSNDTECCADGRVAIGRTSFVREIKGADPEKNIYPSPPALGLGLGLNTPMKGSVENVLQLKERG
jgi:hypothetical protein